MLCDVFVQTTTSGMILVSLGPLLQLVSANRSLNKIEGISFSVGKVRNPSPKTPTAQEWKPAQKPDRYQTTLTRTNRPVSTWKCLECPPTSVDARPDSVRAP